jgi:hypothetical protein
MSPNQERAEEILANPDRFREEVVRLFREKAAKDPGIKNVEACVEQLRIAIDKTVEWLREETREAL